MSASESRRPSRSHLNDLVVMCLERIESDGPEALEAFCGEHPEESETLRRRMQHLEAVGMLDSEKESVPEKVGEFRLLEVLGRGGMGVVYRAEQTSLGRIVAVKVVRSDGFTPDSRTHERFHREIEAATRLSHPNVVQMYTAGSEAGVPYFAMEYVDGASLSSLLHALEREDPARLHGRDLRRALEQELGERAREWNDAFFDREWQPLVVDLMHQVALAIVHAHDRGVWHRDLKPSNVMLTAAGIVKVVDFGLASLRDASRMTLTGPPLGSLPYIAPELFKGPTSSLTPAADVYALGVLMYELLTLRLPFWDKSPERLIQRIVQGAARSPRQLNRSVSRNVAIVCERALAPEIELRHQTPRELSEDLQSLRRGQEVSSRPPGPWRAARRWVRRHPAWTTALALVTALLLTFGLFLRERTRAGSGDERSAAARSAAHRSVREILSLSRNDLSGLPGEGGLARLRSVDAATRMWKVYYDAAPEDPETRLTWARLSFTRANTLRDLGRPQHACEDFDSALAIFRQEASRSRSDPAITVDLAAALYGLAVQYQRTDRVEQSLPLLEEAIPRFAALQEADPQDEERAHHLLVAESYLAETRGKCGDPDAARNASEACASRARGFRERWPESVDILEASARALLVQSNLARELGDPSNAVKVANEALAWLEGNPERAASADLRDVEARLLEARALAARVLGNLEEGDRSFDRAIRATEELIATFPHWPIQRRNLASLFNQRARSAFEAGKFEDGWKATGRALELMDLLVAEFPEDPLNQVMVAVIRSNHAHSLLHSDPEQAAAEAQDILDRYLATLPEDGASMLRDVGVTCAVTVARGMTAVDELDQGEEALLQWQEPLLSDDPWHHRLFADAWNEWVLGVRRSASLDQEQRRQKESQGIDRMFERLEAAVECGYRDLRELNSTESLASFRDDPRFRSITERIGR